MGRQFVVPIIASFLVLVISGVNAWSAMLDKQSDVSAGWTLDGAFEYYKSGEQIPRLKAFLPQGFDYKNIRSAEGLWAVLSDPGEEESVAKFGYRLSSDKVIDSVTVTYSLGGNATLYLLDANNDTEPIYKIEPSSDHKYQLLTVTIPLETISSVIIILFFLTLNQYRTVFGIIIHSSISSMMTPSDNG